MRRLAVPLLIGVLGAIVLISLGIWQVQRLAWKEAVLARIDARISAPAGDLPADPDPARDEYAPVAVEGDLTGPELHVLVGVKNMGAGYRVIQALDLGERRIMVDRGFIPEDAKDASRAAGHVSLIGNLHWPDEVDGFTPEPDREAELWFARDVPAMAQELGTAPVLLVVRRQAGGSPEGITPLPVDGAGIPNDHLQYAITWFSLAVVWLGMTGYLLWRIRRGYGSETTRGET